MGEEDQNRLRRLQASGTVLLAACDLLIPVAWVLSDGDPRGWTLAVFAVGIVLGVAGLAVVLVMAVKLKRLTGSYWPRGNA